MTSTPPPDRPDRSARTRGGRDDFRAHVKATRADFERQVQATKAQFDATNELIAARTGRNLILAILIGLALGGVVLFSLIVVKELFLIVAVIVSAFAALELADALRVSGRRVPRIPTVIGVVVTVPAAYYLDAHSRWLAFLGVMALVVLWRLAEQLLPARRRDTRSLIRDAGAGMLIQLYVPFLASFAILLLHRDHGQWWTLAFLLMVIAIDTGAYATGLMLGKHPMAPRISPKKTWEGFAGAGLASVIAGILLSLFMIGMPWWFGIIFGLVLLGSATLGDLAESLIKRDLGIKDMSSWLPGHGGFLDRLDSILPSAFAAYALFLLFA